MKKKYLNLKTLSMVTILIGIMMLIFDNNQKIDTEMNKKVYKILTYDEWQLSKEKGFIKTDLDIKDGFVHLSTATQLTGTLYYYFTDLDSLMLIQFSAEELGKDLIFEEPFPEGNRNGKFPHYYSKLTMDKILNYWDIQRGAFNLPEEVILEQENFNQ